MRRAAQVVRQHGHEALAQPALFLEAIDLVFELAKQRRVVQMERDNVPERFEAARLPGAEGAALAYADREHAAHAVPEVETTPSRLWMPLPRTAGPTSSAAVCTSRSAVASSLAETRPAYDASSRQLHDVRAPGADHRRDGARHATPLRRCSNRAPAVAARDARLA